MRKIDRNEEVLQAIMNKLINKPKDKRQLTEIESNLVPVGDASRSSRLSRVIVQTI